MISPGKAWLAEEGVPLSACWLKDLSAYNYGNPAGRSQRPWPPAALHPSQLFREPRTGGGLQYVGSLTTASGATLVANVSASASASSGLATPRFAISAFDSITSLPPVLM